MSSILNFLADYYFLFIIISVILLFALIGFIVGARKKNKEDDKTASATELPASNAVSNTPGEVMPIVNDNNVNTAVENIAEVSLPDSQLNNINTVGSTPAVEPATVVQDSVVVPTTDATVNNEQSVDLESTSNSEPTVIIEEPNSSDILEPENILAPIDDSKSAEEQTSSTVSNTIVLEPEVPGPTSAPQPVQEAPAPTSAPQPVQEVPTPTSVPQPEPTVEVQSTSSEVAPTKSIFENN